MPSAGDGLSLPNQTTRISSTEGRPQRSPRRRVTARMISGYQDSTVMDIAYGPTCRERATRVCRPLRPAPPLSRFVFHISLSRSMSGMDTTSADLLTHLHWLNQPVHSGSVRSLTDFDKLLDTVFVHHPRGQYVIGIATAPPTQLPRGQLPSDLTRATPVFGSFRNYTRSDEHVSPGNSSFRAGG